MTQIIEISFSKLPFLYYLVSPVHSCTVCDVKVGREKKAEHTASFEELRKENASHVRIKLTMVQARFCVCDLP